MVAGRYRWFFLGGFFHDFLFAKMWHSLDIRFAVINLTAHLVGKNFAEQEGNPGNLYRYGVPYIDWSCGLQPQLWLWDNSPIVPV